MATYRQVQAVTRLRYGFVPKTCWIAHVKEQLGLPMRKASNRQQGAPRKNPCPQAKRAVIVRVIRSLAS